MEKTFHLNKVESVCMHACTRALCECKRCSLVRAYAGKDSVKAEVFVRAREEGTHLGKMLDVRFQGSACKCKCVDVRRVPLHSHIRLKCIKIESNDGSIRSSRIQPAHDIMNSVLDVSAPSLPPHFLLFPEPMPLPLPYPPTSLLSCLSTLNPALFLRLLLS